MLALVPSPWEQRLTARLCERIHLDDCYVAVESRDVLENEHSHFWLQRTWTYGDQYYTLDGVRSRCSRDRGWLIQQRARKRASLSHPERMARSAPTFGLSPSEKRILERHGHRRGVRYTLSDGGVPHVAHRDRTQLPAARETWSTSLTTDHHGRRRHLGHRIDT